MATAVETSSEPRVPSRPTNLALASLAGALYVAAAVAAVLYAVPALWQQYVDPAFPPNIGWVSSGVRLLTQVAAAAGLFVLGRTLAGPNPVRGLRGGIFLIVSAACAVFFLTRAVGLWAEAQFEAATARVLTAAVGVGLLAFAVRLVTSARGTRWMVGIEEQGWLHLSRYKPALGQKVRRLTLLGILLVFATGVYALINQGMIPEVWSLAIPFLGADGGPRAVALVPAARYVLPVVLLGAGVWVAFRAVNLPVFAEFLIATEAEMNKVSWSTRKRLAQDTVVVLVTTLLMALFLLATDLFWGWLLTSVDVLPAKTDRQQQGQQAQESRW